MIALEQKKRGRTEREREEEEAALCFGSSEAITSWSCDKGVLRPRADKNS